MAVIAGNPHFNMYLDRLWAVHNMDREGEESRFMDIKSSHLPLLETKSYHRDSYLSSHDTQLSSQGRHLPADTSDAYAAREDRNKLHYKKFRSHVKPGIFKGKSHTIAMDPQSHLQLVREKQALHEHRTRPKTPITLQPVTVFSLSRPKSRRPKLRNQRLTRSAPELLQARTTPDVLTTTITKSFPNWGSDERLMLPSLLNRSSNRANSRSLANSSQTGSHSGFGLSLSKVASNSANSCAIYPDTKLEINSRRKANKSAVQTKTPKLSVKALKIVHSNYHALREQRMEQEKARVFDSETLTVNAHSVCRKHDETVLEVVEKSQERTCRKYNGHRSCGICPTTAGSGRSHYKSCAFEHLPGLSKTANKENISQDFERNKTKTALIVQLPNITYSRANTPASALFREHTPATTVTESATKSGVPSESMPSSSVNSQQRALSSTVHDSKPVIKKHMLFQRKQQKPTTPTAISLTPSR